MPTGLGLVWGQGLRLNDRGGLALVSGQDLLRERLLRRFLTCSVQTDRDGSVTRRADYRMHPNYGGNARLYVDEPRSGQLVRAVQQRLTQQCLLESEVAAATVHVRATVKGIVANAYVRTKAGQTVEIAGVRIA